MSNDLPTVANPSAFDAFAATYDANFTHTQLGVWLRHRVWRTLATHFVAGQHILELGCGTGEDARWLGQQGIHVTATDGAAAMIEAAQQKARQQKLQAMITVKQISLQAIMKGEWEQRFDGAFSNFGGLNTIETLRPLARALAMMIPPGGKVILVLMGPICPWEIGWHILHGEWQTAVRRFRQPAFAPIGQARIPIWYPSARKLRQEFKPWFGVIHIESLGFWLPPSYLGHLVRRRPGVYGRLHQLEKFTARLTRSWGDHYIAVLQRQELTI